SSPPTGPPDGGSGPRGRSITITPLPYPDQVQICPKRAAHTCGGATPLLTRYVAERRCPGTWWAPPPSKRVRLAIPAWRVRFPSTSADDRRPLHGEQVARPGIARRMAQLRHGPGLDLADPLAGEVEVRADLFERPRLAPHETEPE